MRSCVSVCRWNFDIKMQSSTHPQVKQPADKPIKKPSLNANNFQLLNADHKDAQKTTNIWLGITNLTPITTARHDLTVSLATQTTNARTPETSWRGPHHATSTNARFKQDESATLAPTSHPTDIKKSRQFADPVQVTKSIYFDKQIQFITFFLEQRLSDACNNMLNWIAKLN